METAEQSDSAASKECEVELTAEDSPGQETREEPSDGSGQVCVETDSEAATREDLLHLFPEPPDAMQPDRADDEATALCPETTQEPPCPGTGPDDPPCSGTGHQEPPCPGTGHDNPPCPVTGHQEPPYPGTGHDNPPCPVTGHQEPPCPGTGHDDPPCPVTGHQEPPCPGTGHDDPPCPVTGHQEPPYPGTGHDDPACPGTGHQEPPCPGTGHQEPPCPGTGHDEPPCPGTGHEEPPCPGTGHEELNRNESIASSVSDTLSSADSVYENEAHRKRQDTQEQGPEPQEDGPPGPRDGDDEGLLTTEPEEDPVSPDIPCEAPTGDEEESILEHYIQEEAMSDVSNESYRDLEVDECLRVEIAVASSDSDTDEKWRAIFSSSINREDDDSYLDSLQLSAQELFVQKTEAREEEDDVQAEETPFEDGLEDEVLEQPIDIVSFSSPPQEVVYNPLSHPGLSKISEDDSENGKDASHRQLSSPLSLDATKKLPKDFCVIQETKSENVSTEHVDFQVARKQWLEMEEQSKMRIVSPTAKTPTLHGSHSFMYTPVRNVERPQRREHSLENMSPMGDHPLTQFSPCSEDSGLDDLSYRSPFEDPETPVEREIRAAMEREDHFRKGRGFSRMGKSMDCAPSRGIPRSSSTPLTPSFIITSSPAKGPLSHEVVANNVIILEPGEDFSSGPHHKVWEQAGEEGNNSSVIILETSNLIIRSASEFCLSKVCEQPQEKTFLNNPFFKLRSRSSVSLVDEEIRAVKQREEELRKERASVYGRERLGSSAVSPSQMDSLAFSHSADIPEKCKSSPSSPMKTAYRMERAALSCDHRFPDVYSKERRKSALALRWEAGEFAGEFAKND